MRKIIVIHEKGATFSIWKAGIIFMKLCVVILLALMVIFLNFNQSYAQVSSNSTNETAPAAVSLSNLPSNATTPASLYDEYYKRANDLFDQGNYLDAIFFYNKAIAIDQTSINALYNKALALDKLGKTSEAISYYNKVLAIAPNDTDTLNNIGADLHSLGKHEEAISYYNKVLAITPNDIGALYNIGLALDSLGKHDKATFYYNKILAIDPANVDALNKMNLTFNNANKTEINVFQKIDKTSLY